jgi:hypothetical protein
MRTPFKHGESRNKARSGWPEKAAIPETKPKTVVKLEYA